MIPITIHDHIADDLGTIIINDYELATMGSLWDRKDLLIERMQSHKEFSGCARWCDLDVRQIQILATLHIAAGINDPLVEKGLRLVLAALCVRLQDQIAGELNLVTIHRFEAQEIHIDFSASLAAHKLTPRRPRFTIVK